MRLFDILNEMIKPILYDTYTIPSRSYAANSTFWLYAQDYQVPEHTGYAPIGIIGTSPSQQSVLVCAPLINFGSYGRRLAGYIRNASATAVTDTVALTILYVKTSSLAS